MSVSENTSVSADSKAAGVTIPPMGIVLSMVAMAFLAAGAYGLMSPEAVPQLAAPAIAWSLIAVGVMLDAAALFVVIGAAKPRRRRGD